jgi:hypothetical protein
MRWRPSTARCARPAQSRANWWATRPLREPRSSAQTRASGRAASISSAHAQGRQPLRHHAQVFVLAEGVEAHPQAEALGQRNLLFHHLAGVDLAVLALGWARLSVMYSGSRWRRLLVA